MKKLVLLLFLLLIFSTGCSAFQTPAETVPADTTAPATVPTTTPTVPPTEETEPETTLPPPVPVVLLTEEEQTMLLKIGMAELGKGDCTECVALVMCTVLNRVNEENRFGSSIRSVLFAQDQFTPVMDGSYETAQPNDRCREALDMVIYGWDESQGALYYEWCEGESWHSQNLHLLFQHCDTRFYD
jgi:N-acetylmuramoyl-L-alanine amidase